MKGFDNLPALQINKSALSLMCFTLSPEYVASILKKIFYALENDETPDMDDIEKLYFKEIYPSCRKKAEEWIEKSDAMKDKSKNPNAKVRKRKKNCYEQDTEGDEIIKEWTK